MSRDRSHPEEDSPSSSTVRVLTVDSDRSCRDQLSAWLRLHEGVEHVCECLNGGEALAGIHALNPHIVFLGTDLPGMNGFEIAAALGNEEAPVFIFLSDTEKFAARAFEMEAADYLLKPFSRERFSQALRRAKRLVKLRAAPPSPGAHQGPNSGPRALARITVLSQGHARILKVEDIDWIGAANNYVEIHSGSHTHLLRIPLKRLAAELPGGVFARISRSAIVNINCIQEIRSKGHGDFHVVLKTGARIDGSRTCRGNLLLK